MGGNGNQGEHDLKYITARLQPTGSNGHQRVPVASHTIESEELIRRSAAALRRTAPAPRAPRRAAPQCGATRGAPRRAAHRATPRRSGAPRASHRARRPAAAAAHHRPPARPPAASGGGRWWRRTAALRRCAAAGSGGEQQRAVVEDGGGSMSWRRWRILLPATPENVGTYDPPRGGE
eukprot:gene5652-biopygen13300